MQKARTPANKELSEGGSARARKPLVLVGSLAFLLLLSSGISFVGYHYLQLSSEYRKRNFIHLSRVTDSLDTVSANPILRQEAIAKLRSDLGTAKEQAVWCIANLSAMERRLFRELGGDPAFEICGSNIKNMERALALIDRIEDPSSLLVTGSNSAFRIGLELRDLILTMRQESQDFKPHLTRIEDKLFKYVQYGTGLGSLILLLLVGALSRDLLANWRVLRHQTVELEKFNARFTAAMNASRDGFAVVDQGGFLIASNEKFRRLISPDEHRVKPGLNIATIFRRAVLAGHFAAAGPGRHGQFIRENSAWLEAETPEKRFELSGDRHIDVKVDKTGAGDRVIVINDVTESYRNNRKLQENMELLVDANREVEFRALHDPLTDLANRRYLDLRLAENEHAALTLLHLDLDRFKQVNDLLGHAAGDFVLKHVASILTDCVRDGDLVARVGGDEFAILCGAGTTETQAHAIAERVLEKFEQPVHFDGRPCNIGTSIGIARAKANDPQKGELLNWADSALYEAKVLGKGRICHFSDELDARLKKDRDLTQRFRTALEAGEFVPYYQTQHCAQTWRVSGVEVLARWNHPDHGILAPNRFLHIARQLGLESALDSAIFERALADIEDLDAAGVALESISFNVSAGRILDPNFAATAREKIPAPRGRFGFEILETVSVEGLGDPLKFAIDNLKDLGFRIEIDDFGSGHASIKSVLELAPNALKIDRELVRPLDGSEQTSKMVTSIIELGRALDVDIVVEGVETELQARLLQQMGCQTLQGYYFSRPSDFEYLKHTIATHEESARRA